jgi:hypothetical protein
MKLSDVKLGDRVRFRFGFSDGPVVEGTVTKVQPKDAPVYTRDSVFIKTDDPKVPACKSWKWVEEVELVGK